MKDWAKREIELACKKENPEWDGKSFDYGCACYQSALKAYECLMEDGHSGMSYGFTKNILKRLLDELPLSPITEEDFFPDGAIINNIYNDETLNKKGLKSVTQCPRCYGLFRTETIDGKVTYSYNNRVYCRDIHNPNITYHNSMSHQFVDNLFPIKMPFFPKSEKYVVYTEDFLVDKNNGDYDTKAFLYIMTPDKEKIEINKFYAEKDKNFVEISEEEYIERRKNKLFKFCDE